MPKQNKPNEILRTTARRLAVAAIVISPWLIGSSDGWAYLLICTLIGITTITWLFSLLSQKSIKLTSPAILLSMILFAAFTACQTIPLPEPLAKTLNPTSAETTIKTAEVLQAASKLSTPTLSPPPSVSPAIASATVDAFCLLPSALSVSPAGTRRALILIIAFVSLFAILSNTMKTWSELRGVAIAIVTSGAIMAFLGTIHKFSGTDKILWFYMPRYGGTIFGPFTNSNHFALHINMIIGLALGLFMSNRIERQSHIQKQGGSYIDYNRIGRMALLLLAMTIMGGASCFSRSRGGIVALLAAVGTCVMFSKNSNHPDQKQQSRKLITASIFLVVAGTIWFGWEAVVNELGTLSAYTQDPLKDSRFTLFKNTLSIFKKYPVFGSGFGTFQYVFPSFQSLTGYGRYTHAHNDWVQLLAEGGIIGAGIFLSTVVVWGRYLHLNFKKAVPRAKSFTVGILIGIIATAIHSMWEYGIHKPASGFLLMGLAALATAAVSMREEPSGKTHRHEPKNAMATVIPSGRPTRFTIVGLILLMSWIMGSVLLQFQGELAYTRFIYYQKLANKAAIAAVFDKTVMSACSEAEMMQATPLDNPAALRETSDALLNWSRNTELTMDTRTHIADSALNSARYSTTISPTDYIAWLTLARTHAVLGQWEKAEIYLNHARSLAAPGMPVRMFVR